MKKAPGTWGSLVALPVAALLMYFGPLTHMAVTAVLTILAILICERYESQSQTHDDSSVVIDEVVGMFIALVWLPLTWQSLLAGFVLFRFFDILKPFPISWADRKIPGGVGVMADDILAGIVTNILLQVVLTKTNWLGNFV